MSEDMSLGVYDEYGLSHLGNFRGLYNSATYTRAESGAAMLADTPNISVHLPTLEALAGGEITESHVVTIRGKDYPVRVAPRKNAHALANIELRRSL